MNTQDELFETLKLAKAEEAAAGKRVCKLEAEHAQALEEFHDAQRSSRMAPHAIERAALPASAG